MPDKLSSLRIPDMPAADQGAEMWLVNFAERLAYDPGRFGVSAELCDRVWDAAAAYSKAHETATRPGTRTTVAVEIKTLRRNEAVLMSAKPMRVPPNRCAPEIVLRASAEECCDSAEVGHC